MRSLMLAAVVLASAVGAQEPRAARSVHLHYPAPAAELAYNEVTVEESRPGTYFCALGFSSGYFGIQELGQGKKLVIFSVWDPGNQDDPNAVPAEKRVELLGKGEGVRTGRFGNEGTGGQSFFDHDWKVGETYRFLIRSKVEEQKTTYSAHFYLNAEKRWQHIATFRTLNQGAGLKGYYSFVEDFRRDGKSATERRSARFGGGWVRPAGGVWVGLFRARFTADNNPILTINAEQPANAFRLITGGDTRNETKLNTLLERPSSGLPPRDLPAAF